MGSQPGFYSSYKPDNSDVIAILLDLTNYPSTGQPTVNMNHVKNPKRQVFLTAHMSGDTVSSGVGTDLVYRDPDSGELVIADYKTDPVPTGDVGAEAPR